MKSLKIIFTFIALAVCFNSIDAQEHKMSCCSSESKKSDSTMNESKCDSTEKMDMQHEQHKHSDMKADKQMPDKSESLVRKGTIELKSIDKNKDGKVFQCPMDWNVISDKAENCPLCKMKLKEVTNEKAKENLIKNGFKVK